MGLQGRLSVWGIAKDTSWVWEMSQPFVRAIRPVWLVGIFLFHVRTHRKYFHSTLGWTDRASLGAVWGSSCLRSPVPKAGGPTFAVHLGNVQTQSMATFAKVSRLLYVLGYFLFPTPSLELTLCVSPSVKSQLESCSVRSAATYAH